MALNNANDNLPGLESEFEADDKLYASMRPYGYSEEQIDSHFEQLDLLVHRVVQEMRAAGMTDAEIDVELQEVAAYFRRPETRNYMRERTALRLRRNLKLLPSTPLELQDADD